MKTPCGIRYTKTYYCGAGGGNQGEKGMFPVELRIKKGDGHRKDQDGGGNIFYGGGEGHHQKRAHQKAQQCRKALHAGARRRPQSPGQRERMRRKSDCLRVWRPKETGWHNLKRGFFHRGQRLYKVHGLVLLFLPIVQRLACRSRREIKPRRRKGKAAAGKGRKNAVKP